MEKEEEEEGEGQHSLTWRGCLPQTRSPFSQGSSQQGRAGWPERPACSQQGKHTCPRQPGSHLQPGSSRLPGAVSSAPRGLAPRGCCSPSTKGCFPSWQNRKVEHSGRVFQRSLDQGWPQRSRWSWKRAGSVAGQTPGACRSPCPRRLCRHSEPWALAAHTPAVSEGLCPVERWLGSRSEQAKSPIRHCIT